MKNGHRRSFLYVLASLLLFAGCTEAPRSSARRVATRVDLIGGPSALGEIGDFLLENDKIRVIIQDKGFSRGFGVYGGSLIDIDRVRPNRGGTTAGGRGKDQFGELFPVAFLQALVPDAVEIVNDGADGKEAIVRVSGAGGDFLSLTKALNQAILNSHVLPESPLDAFNSEALDGEPQIGYEVLYGLKAGDRFVRITVRMTNLTDQPLPVPSLAGQAALGVLGVVAEDFQAPLGLVTLFGAGNKVFSPGSGYGLNFAIEEAYRDGANLTFPALPGLLTPALVSTSKNGISYGIFAVANDETPNFVQNRVDADGENPYEKAYGQEVGSDTMLVPFVASAFTALFYAQTPNQFEVGQSIEYTTYFAVGDGDAASVLDVAYDLQGKQTGLLTGQVSDALSGAPVAGASVIIYDENERPINQLFSNEAGRIRGQLPAGRYTARVEQHPLLSDPVPFTVDAGKGEHLMIAAPSAGRITVTVRDQAGQPLPAKVTVVGVTDADKVAENPRDYLFDVKAGQHWRTSDMVPDDADDAESRRFIEDFGYTDHGQVTLELAPNRDWTLFISRGTEYDITTMSVRVDAGEHIHRSAELRRTVDTAGYISADFHLHAKPSLDSSLPIDERVLSVVGEGVEVLVATDHNFITDYAPTIEQLQLQNWATSMIGLELTTLESGHFNGYPLRREVGAITKGAFEWSLRPPDELFSELRSLGEHGPENTIVQVNHPRDTILGYFEEYSVDPLTGALPDPPDCTIPLGNVAGCVLPPNGPAFRTAEGESTFSYAFDAIEVFNASVIGQFHHSRMPASIEGLEVPDAIRNDPPPVGSILCEDDNVATAGAADDWFNLLNLGYRYIGTGTSDSHDADDHPGAGRSYVYVGDDDPARVTSMDVVRGLKSRRVIMTSGPFVEFTVNAQPIGSDVGVEEGRAELKVDVAVPNWIDVSEGIVWGNGRELLRFPITIADGRFTWSETLELTEDTWLIVEVIGHESMFPIFRPSDIPPILIGDALSALVGPLGFGASALGDLEVKRIGTIKPLAMTNPIWVDVDGDTDNERSKGCTSDSCAAFEAPGPRVGRCEGYHVVYEKSRVLPTELPPAVVTPRPVIRSTYGFPKLKGDLLDVRTIFEQFGRHSH